MTDKEIDYKILQRENENLLKANKDLVREIDALREENKQLKVLIAEYAKPIDKFIKDRENKAVKEFAEKLKEKLFSVFGKTICSDFDTEDITLFIDELLKEYNG